jgi:hypothetical protein
MNKCKTIDNYIFCLSRNPNKKYDVFRKDTHKFITSFGATGYSHFYDKIGLLPKSLNHKDEKRKERYYQRHGKSATFESAKYFSHRFLW